MTTDPWTRPEWDRAALLTIDTQVDFVEGGASPIPGTAAVLPAVAGLAAAFRREGRPIVHVVRLYRGEDVDLARRAILDAVSGVDERHLAEAERIGATHASAAEVQRHIAGVSQATPRG